jgi:hypothetical protein
VRFIWYGDGVWLAKVDSGPYREIVFSIDNGATWDNLATPSEMIPASIYFYNNQWIIPDNSQAKVIWVQPSPGDGIPPSSDGWIKLPQSNFHESITSPITRLAYSEELDIWVGGLSNGQAIYSNGGNIGGTIKEQKRKLRWNGEPVLVKEDNATFGLSRGLSSVYSGSGSVRIIQEDEPEDLSYTITTDSGESILIDLSDSYTNTLYGNGELWYQPSTNTLHIRDSDEWVPLFQ